MTRQRCLAGEAMRALHWRGVTLAILVVGCSGVENGAAGRLTVKNVWELVEPPRVTVGGRDTRRAFALSRVAGAVVTQSGNIVIADGGSGEVRFYDRDGRLVTIAGREGSGPGEFRAIRSIHRSENLVVVWDSRARRVTTFDDFGRLVRTSQVEWWDDSAFPPTFVQQIVGVMPDGAVIAVDRIDLISLRDHAPGEYVDTATYALHGPDGGFKRVIASAPRKEQWLYNEDRSWGTTDIIFGGETLAAVVQDKIIFGWTRSAEIHGIGQNGDTLLTLTVPFEPTNVTSREVETVRESMLQRSSEESGGLPSSASFARIAENDRRFINEVGHNETMPRFSGLLADAEGNLWIGEYVGPAARIRRWLVVELVGGETSAIDIPTSIEVLYATHDVLLGLTRDELDVETVGVYTIRR